MRIGNSRKGSGKNKEDKKMEKIVQTAGKMQLGDFAPEFAK